MSTFVIFIIILGVSIVIHESGHFLLAKKMKVRIQEFFLGLGGKKLFSFKKGQTEYGIRALFFGGYVKLAGDNLAEYQGMPDEYLSKPPGRRFWIIFSGPMFNYFFGLLCFWFIFSYGYPSLGTKVGGLVQGLGAEESGIIAGDRILAIDGKKVKYFQELQGNIFSKKAGEIVHLDVLRDNQNIAVKVLLKPNEVKDIFGKKSTMGLLGVTPDYDEVIIARHNLFEAFPLAVKKTIFLTQMTYKALWLMITGNISVRDSVTGPLGMLAMTSKVARHGIIALFEFLGLISVSLAIFNLLPLPILDGGHIMFLGLEKIRGRTLAAKTENIITRIGLTLVLFMFIFVTYNDIVKLFGDKIQKIITK